MVRTRRESHHHDGITDPKDLQLPFATKSAKSGHPVALRFIARNCFFRYGQCGRPRRAVHGTAIGRDLLDGYVSAAGSARDYGIADAQMLCNAAAREEKNQ
jgi:hypothetical protein